MRERYRKHFTRLQSSCYYIQLKYIHSKVTLSVTISQLNCCSGFNEIGRGDTLIF